jgi:hypothetical protein
MALNFRIYPWELETLIGQLLVAAKRKPGGSRNRIVDRNSFATCGIAVNLLRKPEDAEAGLYLKRFGALNEMHRIAHVNFLGSGATSTSDNSIGTPIYMGRGNASGIFNKPMALA